MTAPGRDAIAFLHVEGQDAATDLGGEAHVGRFDVAGGAQAIGVLGGLARGGDKGQGGECRGGHERCRARGSVGHHDRSLVGAASSGASMRSAVCCMCAIRSARSTGANIGSSWRPGRAAARSRTAFIISGPMIEM